MNISETGSRDQNSTRTTEIVTKSIQLPPSQGSGSKINRVGTLQTKIFRRHISTQIPPYKQTGLSILSNQAVILISINIVNYSALLTCKRKGGPLLVFDLALTLIQLFLENW